MIYEATLFTNYYGNLCVNRWNYLLTGTPAAVQGSFALTEAMGGIPDALTPTQFPVGSLMRSLQNISSDQLSFVSMSVKAIYNVADFYELPWVPALLGAQTTQGLGPVNAFGWRSSRTRTDIRRGMKRLPGVTEGMVDGGGFLSASASPLAAAVADLMGDVLEYDDEGNTLSFAPIVVSKEPYIPEGKTREAYRYYETLAAQLEHIATGISWQPYPQVRSQTSRQYGRGQ